MPKFTKGSIQASEHMEKIRSMRKKKEEVQTPKDDPETGKKEPESKIKDPETKKKPSQKANKSVKIPAVKFFSGSFPQHEEAGNPIIRKLSDQKKP